MTKQAVTVANTLLVRGRDRGVVLDAAQLMKLVYCAQGWYLALRDRPLITDEHAEARPYGPVFPSLAQAFKTSHHSAARPTIGGPSQDEDVIALADRLLNLHEEQTSLIPHMMFLPESPWDIVWNVQGGKSRKPFLIIPNELIRVHFAAHLVHEPQSA